MNARAVARQVELQELNLRIGAAEKERDVDFLREVLHEDLIFRRADGTFADKDQYLGDLTERTYEELVAEVVDIDERPESAVVTVVVTTRGTSHGRPFEGAFSERADIRQSRRQLAVPSLDQHEIATGGGGHPPRESSGNRPRALQTLLPGDPRTGRDPTPPVRLSRPWFQLGGNQLHLIVDPDSTFRRGKGVDSRDIHFAVRVRSFAEALRFLKSKGYEEDLDETGLMRMKVSPRATAGFPQIYILDPTEMIEINAERLDPADDQ